MIEARRIVLLTMLVVGLAAPSVFAERVADIANTVHNLSVTGPGTLKSTSESQICVFCHTPHGADTTPGAPLWNRQLSGATYSTYSSSSIEAEAGELAIGPGGNSRLCLSCHDGTIAIGNVNVLEGAQSVTIPMAGTGPGGTMAPGAGEDTGFTRRLGVDLTNDHPISFTYDATLATTDGELRVPDGVNVGIRVPGVTPRPHLPLDNGQLQCTSCHDPHLRETEPSSGNGKFLRANRLQMAPSSGGGFDRASDMICLACHDKAGPLWAFSAHANSSVATQAYTAGAAALREFPAGLPVWQSGCLSCHDTHTVAGSRRLLREGTDSTALPKQGGNSAIEQTCYQCHGQQAAATLSNAGTVPEIETDFLSSRRMPLTDQPEVHDIGTGGGFQHGRDFIESQALLGKGAPSNRHVECTDCHNPHRVTRNRLFNADAASPDVAGTHLPGSNLASGVLRGSFGVEPVYGNAAFLSLPTLYSVKRGDGGPGASSAAASPWVTREYQICLKCHSDFAYDTPPLLGQSDGSTPAGTNGLTRYTNQAMEFQAPVSHQGELSTTDSGAGAEFATNNHRSWHPVIGETGRPHSVRNTTPGSFRAPWGDATGAQTMYCSDCHGSNTPEGTIQPVGGDAGRPWGPHGSTNDFILKGEWNATTGASGRESQTPNGLCFKCHNPATYADRDGGGGTGFFNNDRGNLHAYHTDKLERLRCSWCHVAVPHGWKNKALLVNLNDVGPEAGLAPGTQVRNNTTAPFSAEPYYLGAVLKVRTFAPSGNWSESDCGSVGPPGNGENGRDWMRDSNENCANLP